MSTFVQLHLLDSDSNLTYELMVTPEIYARAKKDVFFATKLLDEHLNKGKVDDSIETIYVADATCAGPSTSRAPTPKKPKALGDQKTEVHNWSKDEVLLLIHTYKEHQVELMTENSAKADVWSKIASELNQTLEGRDLPPISPKKCRTKMETLKRHYKNLKDCNKKSGNNKISWIYFDEMEELFGEQPWIKPLSTAGSNIITDIDPEIQKRTPKRQKTLSSFCEQLLAAKKENQEIRSRQHREKIAAAVELTGVVKDLVQCLKEKREN